MIKYFSLVIIFIGTLCFSQESYNLIKNGEKYGLELNGKKILAPIYDTVINHNFITATKDKHKFLFDKNGTILLNDIIAENYKNGVSQKINQSGKMLLIKGTKIISPNTIPKDKNETSEEMHGHLRETKIEKYFIKKNRVFYYSMQEPKPATISNGFDKDLLENTKEQIFLNNSKKLVIESYYNSGDIDFSEDSYYEPLKVSYIILKKSKKYGVWDFKEEKIILPFEYNKIISYQTYLLLEKNGLVTFYPNIGTEPKYKKLEPYIEYFARFETPDGKKGWVDRKGKEYFDQ